jgi:hypothetical protein
MSTPPDVAALQNAAKKAREHGKALDALARGVRDGSRTRMDKALSAIDRTDLAPGAALVAELRAWLAEETVARRQKLSSELRAACVAENVEILVLGRDPLLLRLPPVSVAVDFDRDRSEVLFAQEILGRGEAEARSILEARRKVVAALETQGWDAATYLRLLLEAWRRAGRGSGEWVELVDVLPEIALLQQPKKFRRDPTSRNFLSYGRARFAFDLWRLRRDRTLSTGDWRLTLGPATGGSTRDKSRVLLLEDARGQGQYHLTLRFVREEDHAS